MSDSQDTAKAVALRRLGYTVVDEKGVTTVVDVLCNGPSAGKLQLGDQITAIDGHAITNAADVKPLIVAHHPGDDVKVTVDRDGTPRVVNVKAGSRAGQAFLGISSTDIQRHHFPIDVTIDTERVSGPSAGLAFTLAIIDDLTPGSLTGGKQVAVTGTIAPDGSVGEVGGVEQKAITARTNGVQLMIVPKSEVADARRGAGDVRVVGVDNIEQALDALHGAGGAEVPPPSTTAARS
jgi:PDZ domain-containing protein